MAAAESPKQLARISKDEPLDGMSMDRMRFHFSKLTGEDTDDTLKMLGRDQDSTPLLLHHTVVLANSIGQPTGQSLRSKPAPPSAVPSAAEPLSSSDADAVVSPLPLPPAAKVQKTSDTDFATQAAKEKVSTKRSPFGEVNLRDIDSRLRYLDELSATSDSVKRKCSIHTSLSNFLSQLPLKPTLHSCTPNDVRKFLVWRDNNGKTKVHKIACPFLGEKGKPRCACPLRLASGSVVNLVQKLASIFDDEGRGKDWLGCIGNPAKASIVKRYLKQVSEEQAKAQILPKQAKPFFLSKLKKLSAYSDNQFQRPDLSLKQYFVLVRDQAFFKLQFFAGDRLSDLARMPSQGVRYLPDNSGFAISHSFTKVIRRTDGKCNTFVIKRCEDKLVCPVLAIERYIQWARSFGANLSLGYLFRVVAESGRVLDKSVGYSAMYSRFVLYLTTLGIYEGETPPPPSLRAGCAITLKLSGAAESSEEAMKHVGWFSKNTCDYYTREASLEDAAETAQRLASVVPFADELESIFGRSSTFSQLPPAV
ncbi:uncharacterized protein LOC135492564 [Lineus longissimus]|uniref:uncharacterized protein LOC135492564 n=1 Tax=Lineus longissimus TaxID=88925 RepID=UPI00315CB6D7